MPRSQLKTLVKSNILLRRPETFHKTERSINKKKMSFVSNWQYKRYESALTSLQEKNFYGILVFPVCNPSYLNNFCFFLLKKTRKRKRKS